MRYARPAVHVERRDALAPEPIVLREGAVQVSAVSEVLGLEVEVAH